MVYLKKDLENRQKIEKDSLFSTCVLIGDDIYAFTSLKRLPVKWNLLTREMIILEGLKGYDSRFMADDMLRVGNNIYTLELNGNRVLRYDIDEKICQYYEIGCHKEEWGNYAAVAQWREYVYVFPRYKGEIVKLNHESGKLERINNLYSNATIDKRKRNSLTDNIFFWYGFQDKNIVWLFGKQSNMVLAYDLELNTWKKYELSEEINDCIHVVQYNGYIYILSSEGKVYCWDVTSSSIKMVADCSTERDEMDVFSRIAVTDRTIFLFQALGGDIFCIDLKEKRMEKYMTYPSDFRYCGPDGWDKYYGYCEDKGFYYFAMRSTNYIACVNKRVGNLKWANIIHPATEKYIENYIQYNKNLLDERECSIEDVLNYLDICLDNEKVERDCVSIGSQIFGQVS